MSYTQDTQIANTILQQLKALDNRALWAWGAREFQATPDSLIFKVSNNPKVKSNAFVEIRLNESDLYDVSVFRTQKFERKYVAKINDVYVDMLIDTIDNILG